MSTPGTLGTIGKMPGISKRAGGASTLGKESPFRGFFPFQASPDGQFNTSGGGGGAIYATSPPIYKRQKMGNSAAGGCASLLVFGGGRRRLA